MPVTVVLPHSLRWSRRPPRDREHVAVAVMFSLNGVAFASWMARVPAIKTGLQVSAAQMGLLLLCLSVGAVLAMPLCGVLIQRVGPARAGRAGVGAVTIGMLLVAAGVAVSAAAPVGLGFGVSGLGMSTWDVSMNVQGAAVERRLRRPLMPRLHAAFSLGATGGAVLAAISGALGVGVDVQLLVSAPLIAVVATLALRRYQTVRGPGPGAGGARHVLGRAWSDRRIRMIGLVVFTFALTEGVANDWLALAVSDGLGTSEAIGSIAFGTFAAAMTVTRFSGGWVLSRFGRVVTLRASAALAALGAVVVITAPWTPAALGGTVLWGVGASLGFPVGMSAAADDPLRAAAHVSVVSTIGYTAFLAGPPLVGLLADNIGTRPALLVVPAVATVAVAIAHATATPPSPAPSSAGLSEAARLS